MKTSKVVNFKLICLNMASQTAKMADTEKNQTLQSAMKGTKRNISSRKVIINAQDTKDNKLGVTIG
jgi:hypothetical protein